MPFDFKLHLKWWKYMINSTKKYFKSNLTIMLKFVSKFNSSFVAVIDIMCSPYKVLALIVFND